MDRKQKETGGELTDLPNQKYEEFFSHFSEIDTLPIEQYKVVHLVGYFANKYKQLYDIDYAWKFNSPKPSSSFEVFQIKKLAQQLSSNPSILIGYIDWVFANKVPNLKKRFTSISFLTREDILKEYKFNILLANQTQLNISRATILPSEYQQIILEGNGTRLSTYGDLVFTQQARQAGAFSTTFNETWDACLAKLELLGFNKDILKRIV